MKQLWVTSSEHKWLYMNPNKITEICNEFCAFLSLLNSIFAQTFCYADVLGENIDVNWLDRLRHACQWQEFCTTLLSCCRRQCTQPSKFSCFTATSAGQKKDTWQQKEEDTKRTEREKMLGDNSLERKSYHMQLQEQKKNKHLMYLHKVVSLILYF